MWLCVRQLQPSQQLNDQKTRMDGFQKALKKLVKSKGVQLQRTQTKRTQRSIRMLVPLLESGICLGFPGRRSLPQVRTSELAASMFAESLRDLLAANLLLGYDPNRTPLTGTDFNGL